MSLDTSSFSTFDMDALQAELKNRREQVHQIKESMKWAIKEHEDQINQLRLAISWKQKHTNG